MNKNIPSSIFSKTIKYIVLRMLVPLLCAAISLVGLAVTAKIVRSGEGMETALSIGWIPTLIWFVFTVIECFLVNFAFGYKFHVQHMAIISKAAQTGEIPDNMSQVAKDGQTSRFPSGKQYLTYRNLVKKSIQQLQMELNTFAEDKVSVPVLGQLIKFCQFIIGHALTFPFDMVLCYTFSQNDKTLLASATDGVAIYWDSWKRMINNVIFIAIYIIVGMAVGFMFVFMLVAASFSASAGIYAAGIAGVLVGLMVCFAAKVIIDTRLTIKTIDAYNEEAKYAEFNAEQYVDMGQYSKAFAKLYQKGQDEAFAVPDDGYGNDYGDYDYEAEYNSVYGEGAYDDASYGSESYDYTYGDYGYGDEHYDETADMLYDEDGNYLGGYGEGYDENGNPIEGYVYDDGYGEGYDQYGNLIDYGEGYDEYGNPIEGYEYSDEFVYNPDFDPNANYDDYGTYDQNAYGQGYDQNSGYDDGGYAGANNAYNNY